MPLPDWQLVTALIALVLAAFIVGRRAWRIVALARSTGEACGGCRGCTAGNPSTVESHGSPGFVPLDAFRPDKSRPRT